MYKDMLNKCRENFPFSYWVEDYNDGLGEYSPENAQYVESIFDALIVSLVQLGESAEESNKVALFESAVKRLNLVRSSQPELIETMQREEFCDLFDDIAKAAGIDPSKYGSGDGIATEWREW